MNHTQLALLLSAALIGAAPATAQEIKPGLYQVHTKTTGNNEANERLKRQKEDLAKMTPEQKKKMADLAIQMEKMLAGMPAAERAKLESVMGETGGTSALEAMETSFNADGTTSVKVCLTKERIDQRNMVAQQTACKHSNGKMSGGVMKLAYVCTSPASKGDGELRMTGPNSFSTKLKMVSSKPGKKDFTETESTATLLSANCGSVKPR